MKLLHYIWLAAGFVFLGIGMLGVFLPILPTTPFLMVTVFCFTKGSVRLHKWFIKTKIYQNHVKTFNENRAMTLKAKVMILGFASVMLTFGFYFSNNLFARILIGLVLCIKYYVFIFRIKTISEPHKHKQDV
ncbi:MAG: YbaN family protein [Treponema sp.]